MTAKSTPREATHMPLQRFQHTIDVVRRVFRFAGQDIFSADSLYRYKVFSVLAITLIFVNAMEVLTLFDVEHCVGAQRYICVLMTGGCMQVLAKYLWIPKLRPLVSVIESIGDVYRANFHKTSEYYGICHETAKRTRIVLNVTIMIFVSLPLLIAAAGIVEGYIADHRQPFAHLYLPFVHEYDNNWIFGLVNCYNLFVAMVNIISVLPSELTFFVITANARLASAIVQQDMDKLSAKLKSDKVKADEIKRTFLSFIGIHQQFNDDIGVVDDCFRFYCIAQFLTATLFTILGASLINVQSSFFISYVAVFAGLYELATYCVLGTIIETASSGFYDALFSLDWHLLPPQHQKTYRFLLEHAQRWQVFRLAKVKPVNMETFLATIRMIYSYGMTFAALM